MAEHLRDRPRIWSWSPGYRPVPKLKPCCMSVGRGDDIRRQLITVLRLGRKPSHLVGVITPVARGPLNVLALAAAIAVEAQRHQRDAEARSEHDPKDQRHQAMATHA